MLRIATVDIDSIVVQDSPFNLSGVVFESLEPALMESFRDIGVVEPPVVYESSEERYWLVDGRKRLKYLRETGDREIKAVVLSKKVQICEVFRLLMSSKMAVITESVMNKVQFTDRVFRYCKDSAWVVQKIAVPLGLKPSQHLLEEITRMVSLPEQVRRFLHEKKYSYKQILSFSLLPHELLSLVLSWKETLQLTASVFEELVMLIKDYLAIHNLRVEDIASSGEIKRVFEMDVPPRKKTELIRDMFFRKRFPQFSKINDTLQRIAREMDLPENIKLHWDKTLENRMLLFNISLYSPEDFSQALEKLQQTEVYHAIQRFFEVL